VQLAAAVALEPGEVGLFIKIKYRFRHELRFVFLFDKKNEAKRIKKILTKF